MNFKLAVAQIDPVLGDFQKNIQKHTAFGERARSAGADLVLFPELSLTGYSVKDLNREHAFNPSSPPRILDPLLELSRSISIIAGGIEEDEAFSIFNAAFLFEDGAVRSVHRKLYPPTYGMFEEQRYFQRGSRVRAHDTKQGRIGILICEDLWHISLPYMLASDGARVILSLVASPTRLAGAGEELTAEAINRENHRAYARLLTCYIVFCNRVGYEDGINFWGGSTVVGPDGDVIASAPLFTEELLLVDISDNEVRRARLSSRHFLDEEIGIVIRELNRIAGKGH